jgi:hypothetical protein
MSDVLNPRACDPDAYKTWLKDGRRLLGRAASGWGIFWVAWFVLRGYLIEVDPTPLSLIAFIAASGFMELAHQAVFQRMLDGQVGVLGVFRAIGQMAYRSSGLIVRTVRVRGAGAVLVIGLLYVLMWLVVALHTPDSAAATTPPVVPPNDWGHLLWRWVRASCDASIVPLVFRMGGLGSFVLPLMRDYGLSSAAAWRLNTLAHTKNQFGLQKIVYGSLIGLVLVAQMWCPFLVPVGELALAAVLTCAYADIFGGGYTIKALATAPMKAPRWRAAHAEAP